MKYLILLVVLYANASNLCDKYGMCKGNWGIPRHNMPQLYGKVLDGYAQYRNATCRVVPANSLRMIQSELDTRTVLDLLDQCGINSACDYPLLTAGSYIIDGNHRYAARWLRDEHVNIYEVNADPVEILKELATYPGVGVGASAPPSMPHSPP